MARNCNRYVRTVNVGDTGSNNHKKDLFTTNDGSGHSPVGVVSRCQRLFFKRKRWQPTEKEKPRYDEPNAWSGEECAGVLYLTRVRDQWKGALPPPGKAGNKEIKNH